MNKSQKATERELRRKARARSRVAMWAAAIVVMAGIGYGIANISNIAYDENDITAVRFDDLSAKQKRQALEAANSARCTCGCGMTLAQCVSTDMTCPVRDGNVEKIRAMVRDARAAS